ncbi:metal-binding protein [Candidatus Geothermarchaeota archaeon ex4572_27]|nr:MAG: metal-binding protein [Candidatus Geothermarchaeota archaeon ex4572_27]
MRAEPRDRRALEALAELRVKKYVLRPSGRVYWVVVGRHRDYWVIPGRYCSCDDFYINVVARGEAEGCYHLKAQRLAEQTGRYEVFEVSDEEAEPLIEEWRGARELLAPRRRPKRLAHSGLHRLGWRRRA